MSDSRHKYSQQIAITIFGLPNNKTNSNLKQHFELKSRFEELQTYKRNFKEEINEHKKEISRLMNNLRNDSCESKKPDYTYETTSTEEYFSSNDEGDELFNFLESPEQPDKFGFFSDSENEDVASLNNSPRNIPSIRTNRLHLNISHTNYDLAQVYIDTMDYKKASTCLHQSLDHLNQIHPTNSFEDLLIHTIQELLYKLDQTEKANIQSKSTKI